MTTGNRYSEDEEELWNRLWLRPINNGESNRTDHFSKFVYLSFAGNKTQLWPSVVSLILSHPFPVGIGSVLWPWAWPKMAERVMKGGRRDKWGVNKGLGTDLGAWLAMAMSWFPTDQTRAQVQGFNEDGGVREKGIHFENPVLMWSFTQHHGPLWPRISFLFQV